MKKKVDKKKVHHKKHTDYSHLILGYSLIVFAVVCLFLIVTVTYMRLSHSGVLGINTLLAEHANISSGEDQFGQEPNGGVMHPEQEDSEMGQTGDKEEGERTAVPPRPRPSGEPMPNSERKRNIRIEQRKDGFLFKEGTIGAHTKFPVSLNRETKRLTVSTPSGEKEVAVMPEDAIKSLIRRKVITNFDEKSNNASSSVTLTEKNNKPVFEISGISKQRFFGLIPVEVHKSVDVSAQTGQVISENKSFGQQLLDFFSF